jgi:hypothetical protein
MSFCHTDRNQDYVLGALSANEVDRLEQHLLACARCASEVEDFRALFVSLENLPLPAVPAGIAEAVIERLAPSSAWARLVDRLHVLTRQPVFAAAAGIAAGLVLGLFRDPLALHFGRLTAGIVASASASLTTGIGGVLHNVKELTAVLDVLARLLTKSDPILHALSGALDAVSGPATLISVLLSLATVLVLGRVVGQIRREELSHAKH